MNKSSEKPRPGRRAGQPETRQAILDAARVRFNLDGYTGATVRGIAADAGVDPAMINYFFGSKQKLFEEALSLRANPLTLVPAQMAGPIDGLPRRLLTVLIATWDAAENRSPLLTIITSISDNPDENVLLRNFLEDVIAAPIAARLGEEGLSVGVASIRSAMMASQLVGIVLARYVIRARPLADLPGQAVIDAFAPALEVILLGAPSSQPT